MENKGKGTAPVLLYAIAFLFLLVAGFFGLAEAWARFGFSLVFAAAFLICALQESQYRRFLRRLDELKELISEKHTKEENERAAEKVHEEVSDKGLS
ncbi:MAG: hypothetical protein WBC22_16970 [Sedimentisphaerales bacterium]